MVHLLITADDLTGANDTGVQFAKEGASTFVTTNRDIRIESLGSQVAVLAVDTESRHVSPAEAAARVYDVARRAREAGVRNFYKKTDSALRGNIGAELEALMKAAGSDCLMFIPAYPKASRTTRKGFQYVGDKLLHATAFGRDPLEPACESFVPAVIGKQTRVGVTVLSLLGDESGRALQGGRTGIYVFDCESDNDLRRIGAILAANDALHVTAGPAGFAELLPELLCLPRADLVAERNRGPLLVVGGSVNEASLRQIAFARQHGFVDVVLPPSVLLAKGVSLNEEGKRIAEQTAWKAAQGRDVVVRTIERPDELADYVAQAGLSCVDRRRVCHLAAENMGRFVACVLERGFFGTCAVFGGDSSLGVMKALGSTGLLPKAEIMPGLVLAEIVGSSVGANFITKSGGFGDPDVVLRMVDFLRKDG